jgi:signal transduction histidine kinase
MQPGYPSAFMNAVTEKTFTHAPEYQRLIENLRVVLAIIAGLLMLDMRPVILMPLSAAVIAFSVYAVLLLHFAARGVVSVRRRLFYWLDACWFLLLVFLAGEARTYFFMLLFFPVFFVVWRIGYRNGIELALFSGLSAMVIFALGEADISWVRLIALPLSLIVVCPVLMLLAWVETGALKSKAFAARIVEGLDSRRGFDAIIPDITAQIAEQVGASEAILALETFEGRSRVFCWEAQTGSSELSENAALPVCSQIFSFMDETAFARCVASSWWQRRDRLIGIGSSGSSFSVPQIDHDKIAFLDVLVGPLPLMSVAMPNASIGKMRLLVAGKSLDTSLPSLGNLIHIFEQVGPSLENAYLREQLASEAADTERARIGRDLHDSALQPYIGLKFALEALQRRAGPGNPITPDLARLGDMVAEELAEMREVISGLRGTPGKGGALLSNAVRRQATRFGQLFGIQVDVIVEGEMPVNRRIAGELFHIVAEGLSNIRRHTQARRAWVSLCSRGDELVLSISNENTRQTPAKLSFKPTSLAERAAALEGSVQVDCDESSTTVTVRVPTQGGKVKEQ